METSHNQIQIDQNHRIQAENVVDFLSTRLPCYCKFLSCLRFQDASEKFKIFPSTKSTFSPYDNISSPFILLATCETIYYEFSFIESKSKNGNSLREMYFQVLVDLDILHRVFAQVKPNVVVNQTDNNECFPVVSDIASSLKSEDLFHNKSLDDMNSIPSNVYNSQKSLFRHPPYSEISFSLETNPSSSKRGMLCRMIEAICTMIGIRMTMIDIFVFLRQPRCRIDKIMSIVEKVELESMKSNITIDILLKNATLEANCVKAMLASR